MLAESVLLLNIERLTSVGLSAQKAWRQRASFCHASQSEACWRPVGRGMSTTKRPAGMQRYLLIASVVAGWNCISMTITFTNKWILSTVDFHFPFLMAFLNNTVVGFIAYIATRHPSRRPPPLSYREIFLITIPIGCCTALDIGLSNLALTMLPVSMHTIIRGTVPAFVLLFALIFKLEDATPTLICSIITVVVGIALATYGSSGEAEQPPLASENEEGPIVRGNEQLGVVVGLASCVVSGLRWTITQLLMQARDDSSPPDEASAHSKPGQEACTQETAAANRERTPLDTVFYLAPACALSSFIAAAIFERSAFIASPLAAEVRSEGLAHSTAGTLILPALVAIGLCVFVLLYCEFSLVRLTSSLALSIFGTLKELLTIFVAASFLGGQLRNSNLATPHGRLTPWTQSSHMPCCSGRAWEASG